MTAAVTLTGSHELEAGSEENDLEELVAAELPCLLRELPEVALAVYLAKAANRDWSSPALRRIVERARSSYRTMYGRQVVIFDEYDDKSWVYITVATFQLKGKELREVLSLRFVPAAGRPLLNDDLAFYFCKTDPELDLLQLLARAAPSGSGQPIVLGCYSQGRMGAIRPRARDGSSLAGNHHIGVAWRTMIECFLEDSAAAGQPCRVLTSQTTEELRVLGAQIPTRRCDEQLGLLPGSIVLNRRAPRVRQVCYEVPTYFLNLKDLAALLSRLMAEGWLSPAAIARTLAPGVALERALRRPRPSSFASLEGLLNARGPIADARMTAEELRELADREVRDGPALRLTLLDQLQAQREQRTAGHRQSFIRMTGARNESA